jgi:hypothetical protein
MDENLKVAIQVWTVKYFRLGAHAWNKLCKHADTLNVAQEGRSCYRKAEWENVFSVLLKL